MKRGTLFRLFDGPAQVRIRSISFSQAGTTLNSAGQSFAIEASTNPPVCACQIAAPSVAEIDGTFQCFS